MTSRNPVLAIVAVMVAAIGAVAGSAAVAAGQPDPLPLEYFALRDVMTNVRVAPDGKHVAFLKIPTREGNAVLEVHDTADLEKDPFVLDADPMELRSFFWAADNDIVITLRQQVRDKIEGFNQGVYETKLALLNIKTRKLRSFDELNAAVENVLPHDPRRIIISFQPGGQDQKISEPFRPRAYYAFDLDKGTKQLLIRGKLLLGAIEFDENGDPWLARGYDVADGDYLWYMREPGGKGWTEAFRMSEDLFDDFTVVGKDEAVAGNFLVKANNGNDKDGLWSFNPHTKHFDELIYRRSDVDVAGVRMHSNSWTNADTVVGVAYNKDRLHIEYFDEIEGATYHQLNGLIPYAHDIRITSRSRGGDVLTVYNVGPHDPGTYYLYDKGVFTTIGSKQPLITGDELSDVKYITYTARDGVKVPGFITIPKGEPPFPLIVLPHGGPFVNETVSYDEWGQMLANNGYLVLQPEYRGTRGYGLEYYESAFINGGQGGYKMQDDKDDGALYLVEQGLADRDRMAMFGWSYGGYAALVAASRTPQIYQCVIAGAGVSDPILQVNYYRDRVQGASLTEQVKMWTESVSPIKEAEKVNVPLLLVHGTVDQRVPLVHSLRYRKELDKYGKDYKFVELVGADHFYSTLFYDHQIKLYESMIDFLHNDCGPGGL